MRVVGVGEVAVSRDPEELIVTYSLGSCVGLTLYDPTVRVGGLAHCMLPLSSQDPTRARRQPGLYTDSGVQDLLAQVFRLGARRASLVAKVAGGANVNGDGGLFRIGERNYTILRKVLWKNDILIRAEDVGGTRARGLSLDMASGATWVTSDSMRTELV